MLSSSQAISLFEWQTGKFFFFFLEKMIKTKNILISLDIFKARMTSFAFLSSVPELFNLCSLKIRLTMNERAHAGRRPVQQLEQSHEKHLEGNGPQIDNSVY